MRSVEVNLNGKIKHIRYDFNAIADLEQRYGKGIGSIFSEEDLGFRTLRILYWAGLKWEDRTLTEEKAGELLNDAIQDGENIQSLFEYVINALQLSGIFGKSGESEKNTIAG